MQPQLGSGPGVSIFYGDFNKGISPSLLVATCREVIGQCAALLQCRVTEHEVGSGQGTSWARIGGAEARKNSVHSGTLRTCNSVSIMQIVIYLTSPNANAKCVLYIFGSQFPPSRCPEPRFFHDSGSTPSDLEPALSGCANAVPYGLCFTVACGFAKIFLMKVGVGTRFVPPPKSGQSRVRKSCR